MNQTTWPRTLAVLKQRIVTAVVLLACLIAATTLLSSFGFALFVSVTVMLAAWEWCGLTGLGKQLSRAGYMTAIATVLAGLFLALNISGDALGVNQYRLAVILGLGTLFWLLSLIILITYPTNKTAWNDQSKIAIMGLFALIPVWAAVIQLKYLMPSGVLVIALIILVAAVDVGGYFVGIRFGRRRLAPELSPSKSWEGVWGGLGLCLLVGIGLSWAAHRYIEILEPWQFIALLMLTLLTTFFSIIGDLLESMLKRNRNVKDSGGILPGHGGLLDRVDGLMAAAPIYTLLVMFVFDGSG
ncbi:MAG: phosphatidate cytidylyltransferase [Pseudomonadales bacterium]|jgi:phosphatidate cytidylyltransferase|nr:phosphatidate cytidylyltransferase [Pseudomonadales bacterium]